MKPLLTFFTVAAVLGVSAPTIATDNSPRVRVQVVGIVGHKNYDTFTKPLAGASVTSDGSEPSVTDGRGWAVIASRSCEVSVAARGFEPVRQRFAPDDAGPGCPSETTITLMSTAILMDPKLRRYVDVTVKDASTGRGLSGTTVACVLYYLGSGKPRLAKPKLTDAHGRARVEAYIRLDISSNHWWTSMDRIDLSVDKPHYASEIDTLPQIGRTDGLKPSTPLTAEFRLERS
jgi:hypothetical protein